MEYSQAFRWSLLRSPLVLVALLLLSPAAMVGCRSKSVEETKSFELGDLIEPFDIPTREVIDATEWVDQPVLSSIDLMRASLKESDEAEGEPIPVAEALKLRNDSPEANEKIKRSLGRLAKPDGSNVDYDAKLIRHVSGDLKSINPVKMSSVTEFEYHGLTSFGFIGFDRDFNHYAPAENVVSWQRSADQMMDKIVLRDDLTWSDGKPITAHDIEFTFKLILSSQVIVPAVRQGASELAAVKAYDDQTIVFFHKESLSTNTTNISITPVPRHIYEKSVVDDPTLEQSDYHRKFENNPVVGGAYELVRRVRNQEFVVRRRESYFMHDGKQVRSKPHFASVRVKVIDDVNTALVALKEGEIEEMMLRAEQWAGQTDGDGFYKHNTKATAVEWTSFHFCWNQQSPLFADKRVRWAMTYAMDYDELLNTVCYGLYQPNQGSFHPTSWMFPKNGPEPITQDLDRARKLLKEAGWADTDNNGVLDKEIGGRRVPFEFTMLCGQTDGAKNTSTLMKGCLDQIGIICHVKPTEFTALTEANRTHKFQATMGGWGTGTDPDTTSNIFATDAGRNYGKHSDPLVDELFKKGQRTFGRDERAKIYGEIHTRLWEEQPYTWLFYRNAFYAFNKKLRGYNFSPRGPYDFGPGFESIYVPAATGP